MRLWVGLAPAYLAASMVSAAVSPDASSQTIPFGRSKLHNSLLAVGTDIPELSEPQIKAVFEPLFGTNSFYQIPIGTLLVWKAEYNTNLVQSDQHLIYQVGGGYKSIMAAQQAGLVVVQQIPTSAADNARYGAVGTFSIAITLTPAGAAAQTCNCPKLLQMHMGVISVKSIIKNDLIKKGLYDYRIVMLTYTKAYTDEYQRFSKALGDQGLENDFKAIVLFKFDPFKSSWVLVTEDIAYESKDFTTDQVVAALGK